MPRRLDPDYGGAEGAETQVAVRQARREVGRNDVMHPAAEVALWSEAVRSTPCFGPDLRVQNFQFLPHLPRALAADRSHSQ
jgi:hypothetical protein